MESLVQRIKAKEKLRIIFIGHLESEQRHIRLGADLFGVKRLQVAVLFCCDSGFGRLDGGCRFWVENQLG